MENFKDIREAFENQDIKELPTISISQVLGTLGEPFDQVGVATKTHDKHFNDPESQYYQKTVEQICEMWSAKGAESCRYGSMLDDYIGYNLNEDKDNLELFELDYDREGDTRLNGICTSFDNFYKDVIIPNKWQFVTREKTVYYDMGEFYVKGRFDALFYNPENGHYIIIDWKSSGEIEKPTRWTKKLLGPCKDLDGINHNTYTLQVYFYKKTLEKNYLPEGSVVDVYIIQLPGHVVNDSTAVSEIGKMYGQYGPNFEYNSSYLDTLYKWAYKKKQILDRKNG